MKRCWPIYLVFAVMSFSGITNAQTLNEQLISEDPQRLIKEARENGDIVRGAILFHQGSINCAKCHRSITGSDRIGPDLSQLERDVTEQHLVESILEPSKVIKDEFKSVTILTNDGQLFNGLVVRDEPQQLVLRDSQNIDRRIIIARDNIDEIQPSKKSSMPDDLANELKNRRQFLDLLRYVMDLHQRGPESNVESKIAVVRKELSPELGGLVLMQQLNCVACHSTTEHELDLPGKQAPRLAWSSAHLNPAYIESFIADPHATKPGTTMPSVLGHLDPAQRLSAAKSITHYLVSLSHNTYRFSPIDREAVDRGFVRFGEVGCVACHSPRNDKAVEQSLDGSIALGELTQKYSLSALVEFLKSPGQIRPSGHMPGMQLTHREATDIANFLLQSAEKSASPWKVDRKLATQGQDQFAKLNCARCHIEVEKDPSDAPHLNRLAELDTMQGCLSDGAGHWPAFHLNPKQRDQIRAALANFPSELTAQQSIDVSLATFNCIACHDRGDLGGVTDDRNPHFKTTNLNLGDQGRIPPTLTGVGAKLKPKWMRDVLVNGRNVRPYMKTRMPQFGEENIGHLVDLFQATDELSQIEYAAFDDQEAMRKMGRHLAGNQGLNCVACHTYQYKLSDTMPAVDLTEMSDRLKKNWFHQYMLAPQQFSPNTVMPSFWPAGKAMRRDLDGSTDTQIEALWQYLIDGRQAGMPRGVVREPLEIVVTTEARMLRRSYPGIGKRGIGVGFPGSVNLAFDAEQLRLGSIWKGKFADPGGVWTGQGSGNVRPMGKAIEFAKGPELDQAVKPWVVDDERPPNHQFQGYSLDAFRRPTFRYSVGAVFVEDFFSEVTLATAEPANLKRRVRMSSDQTSGQLRFRIASAKKITADKNRVYLIDGRLKVTVISDHATEVVEVGDLSCLQVPISLIENEVQQLELEYQWQ